MISPLKYAFGLALFAITLAVGKILIGKTENPSEKVDSDRSFKFVRGLSAEFTITLCFIVSLIAIFLAPPIEQEIFIDWSALPLPTVARLIAAFGMNFFPGYLVLAIIGKHQLGRVAKLVTSYLLSLFLLTTTAFLTAHIEGTINGLYLRAVFLLCSVLIAAYFLKRFINRKSAYETSNLTTSIHTSERSSFPSILVVLTLLFMGVWFCGMYVNVGFFVWGPGSDMWRHLGFAQAFLDYKAFTWLHIPWWFHLYLASFIKVSGAPQVNAYMALYPLIALAALSFYAMVSGFFKDKRIASLATLSYVVFSGSAWLYALLLRDFSPVTDYDTWVSITYQIGGKFLYQGWYPPFVIGLNAAVIAYTSLWWLLLAVWRLDLSRKFNLFLISAVAAMSYLLHGIDAVIFLVFLSATLVACLLIRHTEGRKRVRRAALMVLAALGMVAVIDLSLTSQYDYSNLTSLNPIPSRYYYFNSLSFYALLLVSVLTLGLSYGGFIESRLMQLHRLIYRKSRRDRRVLMKRFSAMAILTLYGLSLVFFVWSFPSLSTSAMDTGWIPWYVYPIVGGIPFFLAFLALALVLLRWTGFEGEFKRVVLMLTFTAVFLFLLGKTTSFVNEEFFFTGFWERRIFAYLYPVASVLMAYTLVSILSSKATVHRSSLQGVFRMAASFFLISLVIVGGVSSTLIAADFEYRHFDSNMLTEEEIEALNFLHYSLPSGARVAYLDRLTGVYYIRAFANDKWTYSPSQWLGAYLHSPSGILSAIYRADVEYLYINHARDSQELDRSLFLQQLIKVLPIKFSNSEVTIYSVPSLHTPSIFSPLSLISSEENEGEPYDAYVLWFFTLMMSSYSYVIMANASDSRILDTAQNIIVSYDPLPIKEEIGLLLEWATEGGHLIVSNSNPYGTFSELFGLTSKLSLMNDNSTDGWRAFYQRGEIGLEASIKIEGSTSLKLHNNQSSWEEWIYTPPAPWNFTQKDYFGIWVYGSGGGPQWYLYLTDAHGNEKSYRYDLSVFDYDSREYYPNFTGWKLHLLPVREYFGDLDLSAIQQLRIVSGFQLPVTMLIGDIFVLGKNSQASSVVLANGMQSGDSFSLPIVEVENINPRIYDTVIANYTWNGVAVAPLAIEMEIGSGRVTYLNINSLYKAIISERSGFSNPHELLLSILDHVGVAA